jgi:hypothetical protein
MGQELIEFFKEALNTKYKKKNRGMETMLKQIRLKELMK